MEERICTKCGGTFPLNRDNFRVNPAYSGGFTRQCNRCSYTPAYGRRKQMERRYGITVEQYENLLAEQGGHCALCPAIQGTHKRRLTVDHNHNCCDNEKACGKCNRGILCANCNRMLGFLEVLLKDFRNPETGEVDLRNSLAEGSWTSRALQYLKRYQK